MLLHRVTFRGADGEVKRQRFMQKYTHANEIRVMKLLDPNRRNGRRNTFRSPSCIRRGARNDDDEEGAALGRYSRLMARLPTVSIVRYRSRMPLIQIFTSTALDTGGPDALLSDLSGALAKHFDKPEEWVMTCLVPGLPMTFGGTPGQTCFAVVKNVGKMTPEKTRDLSADLSARPSRGLGVPKDRIYVEFSDAVGYLWGHDGDTFE